MTTPHRSYRSRQTSDPLDAASTTELNVAAGLPAPRLWRSRGNRVFAGVLGGLAEKFGLEARPLRILYALCTVFTGGLLAIPYLGIWAITQPHGTRQSAPRLWRSREDKVIAGVLGGMAEKWDMNSSFLRFVYVGLTVFSAGFPGVLIYLVLWIITRPLDEYDDRVF
jgi:phage shock protein C